MSRHEPNRRLAALLAEANWSAADLAREVNALGKSGGLELRYERTAVAHWLSGSRPRGPVAQLVAQAFSRRLRRLVTAGDTGLTPGGPACLAPPPDPVVEEADPVRRLCILTRNDVDPARRTFLLTTAFTLTAVALPQWHTSSVVPRQAGHRQVHSADVELLGDMTRTFADLGDRYGGAHARTALAAYLADDATTLAACPASAAVHHQVLVRCAQLTHLLATMTMDAGYPGLSQRYFHTALSLSLRAGDRANYAITLRAMSSQALRLGHTHHAGELARAATETVSRDAGAATRSYLLTQRALIHAAEGERRKALTDLTAAEQQHSRATSPPGPFSSYSQASLDYQRAQTLHALGDRRQALAALQDSARHCPPARCCPYVLTQAQLADRLLQAGQLDEACSHLHLALDHYPSLHSARVDKALTQLAKRLRTFTHQRHATTAVERLRQLRCPRRVPA